MTRIAGLLILLLGVSVAAQSALVDVLARHGVQVQNRDFARAFDEGMEPAGALSPGSFATPLALMTSGSVSDRINAAYTFAILAGRSGRRVAMVAELAAAGQALAPMLSYEDRRARVAAARVIGRVFAPPADAKIPKPAVPAGAVESLFVMLNREEEVEQLAALDALGLLREPSAVASITERYHFYREQRQRRLAGGALEAMARIGDPSAVPIVRLLAADAWAAGDDETALAVAFARERLLKDGSVDLIRQALNERKRGAQARAYLVELGVPVP